MQKSNQIRRGCLRDKPGDRSEITQVRILMLQRGWSNGDLAQRCGLAIQTVNNAFCEGFKHPRIRLLLEDIFGFPVFSTREQWRRRKEFAKRVGVDPYLARRTQLQRYAVDHGIPCSKNGKVLHKSDLITELQHALM